MARVETEPVEVEGDAVLGDKRYEHPAFGCIVVTRWHGGGGQRLFGSDLRHSSGVTLHFHEADLRRGLSCDRHFARKTILEVDITEAQWARLVASAGDGSGTPVTLRYARSGPLVDIPGIAAPQCSKREVHGKEMAEAVSKAISTVQAAAAELREMLEKPGSISKTQLKAIYSRMASIGRLPGDVQFVYDQFAEATEQVAEDAKIEIEAHVSALASRLGLEQLRNMAPRIQEESPIAIESPKSDGENQ